MIKFVINKPICSVQHYAEVKAVLVPCLGDLDAGRFANVANIFVKVATFQTSDQIASFHVKN